MKPVVQDAGRHIVVAGDDYYLAVGQDARVEPDEQPELAHSWGRDDGRYGIDTNFVENSIRPFCLGRRNWLFADTVAGAQASARLYSLVQCAKANGLEPYAYLRRVFTELPRVQSLGDIEALLPTRLTPAYLT